MSKLVQEPHIPTCKKYIGSMSYSMSKLVQEPHIPTCKKYIGSMSIMSKLV